MHVLIAENRVNDGITSWIHFWPSKQHKYLKVRMMQCSRFDCASLSFCEIKLKLRFRRLRFGFVEEYRSSRRRFEFCTENILNVQSFVAHFFTPVYNFASQLNSEICNLLIIRFQYQNQQNAGCHKYENKSLAAKWKNASPSLLNVDHFDVSSARFNYWMRLRSLTDRQIHLPVSIQAHPHCLTTTSTLSVKVWVNIHNRHRKIKVKR